jgi:hypothetical protein
VTYFWATLCLLTWAWIATGFALRYRAERRMLAAYSHLYGFRLPRRLESNRAYRKGMVADATHKMAAITPSIARFARAMTQRPENKPN